MCVDTWRDISVEQNRNSNNRAKYMQKCSVLYKGASQIPEEKMDFLLQGVLTFHGNIGTQKNDYASWYHVEQS